LVDYSEDFSNSWWTKSGVTLTSNNAISPDGSLNASLLKGDGVNSFPRLQSTVSGSGQISFSVFVKKELSDEVTIYISGTGIAGGGETSSVFKYTFSTDSLSIVSGGGVDSSESTSFPNDWVRLTLNYTTTTITGLRIYSKYASTSTDGVYIWGAQLEQQSYATSYIPTNGAIATRLADVCTGAGTSDTFNDSEGVLYAEISALGNDGADREITVSDGTNSNRIVIGYNSSNQIVLAVLSSNSVQMLGTITSNISINKKIAIKYKQDSFSAYIDGIEVVSDVSGVTPIGLNEISFSRSDGNAKVYGKVKDVRYYNTALTDAELQELTS
jgi:hypothetical protein